MTRGLSRLRVACAALSAISSGCGARTANLGSDSPNSPPLSDDGDSSSLSVTAFASAAVVCQGACVTLSAQATGGRAPYTYVWDQGLVPDGGVVQVCPSASATYAVTATDSSGNESGELPAPGLAATGKVLVTVSGPCAPDGGPPQPICDSVASVSPTGENPFGNWSYGWTPTLGGAFSRYTGYVTAPATNGNALQGLHAWSSGVNGGDLNPAAYTNPGPSSVVVLRTDGVPPASWNIPVGTFFMHPGDSGQYSVARWTAPAPGAYRFTARFEGIADPPAVTTTDVHVRPGGKDYPYGTGYLNVNAGGNTFMAGESVALSAGDTIDFAVGNGGNGFISDSTALSATVCTLPP